MKTELVQTPAGSDRFAGVSKTIRRPNVLANDHFPDSGKMVTLPSGTDHFADVNKMVGGGLLSAPNGSANGAFPYQPGATPQVTGHKPPKG